MGAFALDKHTPGNALILRRPPRKKAQKRVVGPKFDSARPVGALSPKLTIWSDMSDRIRKKNLSFARNVAGDMADSKSLLK